MGKLLLQRVLHWTSILTSHLVGKVKLVGSSVSCEGTFQHGDHRQNPHVQSFLMATDQVTVRCLALGYVVAIASCANS